MKRIAVFLLKLFAPLLRILFYMMHVTVCSILQLCCWGDDVKCKKKYEYYQRFWRISS